jgi:hypothetical protein
MPAHLGLTRPMQCTTIWRVTPVAHFPLVEAHSCASWQNKNWTPRVWPKQKLSGRAITYPMSFGPKCFWLSKDTGSRTMFFIRITRMPSVSKRTVKHCADRHPGISTSDISLWKTVSSPKKNLRRVLSHGRNACQFFYETSSRQFVPEIPGRPFRSLPCEYTPEIATASIRGACWESDIKEVSIWSQRTDVGGTDQWKYYRPERSRICTDWSSIRPSNGHQ